VLLISALTDASTVLSSLVADMISLWMRLASTVPSSSADCSASTRASVTCTRNSETEVRVVRMLPIFFAGSAD
jgi:hypothetical protein